MRGRAWPKTAEARLIKAWNQGVRSEALAERFGTSTRNIFAKIGALRAAGVELRQGENAIGALENHRKRQRLQLRLYQGAADEPPLAQLAGGRVENRQEHRG